MPVKLENISSIAPNGSGQIDVPSDLNLVGTSPNPVYRINGVPLATGSQTPWTSDIDGANFYLSHVRSIGIGGSATASALISAQNSVGKDTISGECSNAVGYTGASFFNDLTKTFQLRITGSAASPISNAATIVTGGVIPLVFIADNVERMRITAAGNVGIGTPAPTTKLDVYGGAIVRADASGLDLNPGLGQLQVGGLTNLNQRLYMGFDTTNNCGVIQPGVAFVGWNNLILNPIGGNVGIGTSNPGTILSTGTSTAPIKIACYDSGPGSAVNYGIGVLSGMLTFGAAINAVSGIPQMVLMAAGNLGIGTTTPGSRLSIVGLPTSAAGLSAGDVWNNGGVLNIV